MSTPYFVPPLAKKWRVKKKFLFASLAEFVPPTFKIVGPPLVVSTSAIDCLERLVPEMTCYVSTGKLNSIHSLMHSVGDVHGHFFTIRECNVVICSVTFVSMSVCPVRVLTFESLDLDSFHF